MEFWRVEDNPNPYPNPRSSPDPNPSPDPLLALAPTPTLTRRVDDSSGREGDGSSCHDGDLLGLLLDADGNAVGSLCYREVLHPLYCYTPLYFRTPSSRRTLITLHPLILLSCACTCTCDMCM